MKIRSIATTTRWLFCTSLITLVTACLTAYAAAEVRTWTSADGTRTFEGELLGYEPDSGMVVVRRTDGERLTFQNIVLSDSDIEFLNSVGELTPPIPAAGGGGPAVAAGRGGDGSEPADMSKPVQVFILLGQSNMLGFGKTHGDSPGTLEYAVKNEDLYPFLVDAEGKWRTRKDVRDIFVMHRGGGMNVENNNWLTITNRNIGPEIGIGHHLGNLYDAPVMLLKACIGNRSLGWDLLPPGSKPYEHDGKMQPGYRGTTGNPEGDGSKPNEWYAGKQYDDDIGNAKTVLENLSTYYPDASNYEVAGFFWWQGDKDMRNAAHSTRYEQNLVRLIEQLREDFNAPNAKFVAATLGQTKKGAGGGQGDLLKAKMAVDGNSGKYPQFKGNVATVYTNPLSQGGSSSGHYSGNARTYMDVGLAMGETMVELLTGER